MKYILEKSAVLSFVALKIIVFSALHMGLLVRFAVPYNDRDYPLSK